MRKKEYRETITGLSEALTAVKKKLAEQAAVIAGLNEQLRKYEEGREVAVARPSKVK